MTKTAAQLNLDISKSLDKGTPAPTSVTGWKKLVKEIKNRGWRTTGTEARTMLQRELDAAVDGLRAATKESALKPAFVTGTNLFALAEMVVKYGGGNIPRRVPAVDAPHLKRCVQAGLLEQGGGARGTIGDRMQLTAAGREAVADYLVEKIGRKSARTTRDAKEEAELAALETALASLKR